MKNQASPEVFMPCTCISCGQKIEFPADGVGTIIDCPSCGHRLRLYDGLAITSGQSGRLNNRALLVGWLFVIGLAGFCFLAFSILIKTDNDSSGQFSGGGGTSRDAQVKMWESSLRKSEHDLYGTKVETDEEIHREAIELQKENAQGIGPDGMLIREAQGRHDQ